MERQRERFMEAIGQFRLKKGLAPHCWAWGAILIVILLTTAIRVRLLPVPLERDEGEYAYAGQLILQGIPPYVKVYNMKMPGIYAVYALILAIFGQTHTGIHLGLLTINAVTVILLFLLGKRLYDLSTGVMTGASFAIMSLSPSVQGIFANAEHFVILPAVGGILLLLRAIDSGQSKLFFWSGLLLGTAFIIKQHGGAFVAFAGLYLLMEKHEYALKMQQEMIDEIELARPKFLIFVSVRDSWMRKPESQRLIFDWFNQYQQKYYDLVGIIDILSRESTRYYWDNESVGYLPRSRWWLAVSRRKE